MARIESVDVENNEMLSILKLEKQSSFESN